MTKKLTKDEFVEKANSVHGGYYSYNNFVYRDAISRGWITCPKHGDFEQAPREHLSGKGCKACGYEKVSKSNTLSEEEFFEKFYSVHGKDKYYIEAGQYKSSKTEIKVICNKHGEFSITPNKLLLGQGCKLCGYEKRANKKRYTLSDFINKSIKVHGDKYDYSKVQYKGWDENVEIICPIHGSFSQTPNAHLMGHGCQLCNQSKLEKFVENLLKENNLKTNPQKRFDWLGKQSLDFYLPEYNVAIECQGEQHFAPVSFGSNKNTPEERFNYIKALDSLKYNLCKEHGIEIIYFTTVKDAPNDYIGKLFKNENDLLAYIEEHGKEHSDTDSCKDDIDEMPKQE